MVVDGYPRDEPGERRHGDQSDHGDHEEGGAPAEVLAEEGGGGNTDDVGDGEAEEHRGHGPRLPPVGDQPGCDDGADAEERPVRKTGEHPARDEPAEAGGERGGEVADDEERHQEQQHLLARDA